MEKKTLSSNVQYCYLTTENIVPKGQNKNKKKNMKIMQNESALVVKMNEGKFLRFINISSIQTIFFMSFRRCEGERKAGRQGWIHSFVLPAERCLNHAEFIEYFFPFFCRRRLSFMGAKNSTP